MKAHDFFFFLWVSSSEAYGIEAFMLHSGEENRLFYRKQLKISKKHAPMFEYIALQVPPAPKMMETKPTRADKEDRVQNHSYYNDKDSALD